VGDREVTPRTGQAVEIQALWHNALAAMRDLAAEFGDAERAACAASRRATPPTAVATRAGRRAVTASTIRARSGRGSRGRSSLLT
jgi:hypothetical protein